MLTKRFREIEGLFWMVLGMAICILAWKVQLGTFVRPGPGLVAFVTGLFLFIVGFIMILSQILPKISREEGFDLNLTFRNISWFRLAYTMALLFGYAGFLNLLGYLLTTFLLMWGLLYDPEKKNWALGFLTSVLITGGSYVVFDVWLRSPLPRGVFPWW
jgi:hypothetical protein